MRRAVRPGLAAHHPLLIGRSTIGSTALRRAVRAGLLLPIRLVRIHAGSAEPAPRRRRAGRGERRGRSAAATCRRKLERHLIDRHRAAERIDRLRPARRCKALLRRPRRSPAERGLTPHPRIGRSAVPAGRAHVGRRAVPRRRRRRRRRRPSRRTEPRGRHAYHRTGERRVRRHGRERSTTGPRRSGRRCAHHGGSGRRSAGGSARAGRTAAGRLAHQHGALELGGGGAPQVEAALRACGRGL